MFPLSGCVAPPYIWPDRDEWVIIVSALHSSMAQFYYSIGEASAVVWVEWRGVFETEWLLAGPPPPPTKTGGFIENRVGMPSNCFESLTVLLERDFLGRRCFVRVFARDKNLQFHAYTFFCCFCFVCWFVSSLLLLV